MKTENCGWISPEGEKFHWGRRGRCPIARAEGGSEAIEV